jgi:hypothetical protein
VIPSDRRQFRWYGFRVIAIVSRLAHLPIDRGRLHGSNESVNFFLAVANSSPDNHTAGNFEFGCGRTGDSDTARDFGESKRFQM